VGALISNAYAANSKLNLKYPDLGLIYQKINSKFLNNDNKVEFEVEEKTQITNLCLAFDKIKLGPQNNQAIKTYQELVNYIVEICGSDMYSPYILGEFKDPENTKVKLKCALTYSTILDYRCEDNNYYTDIYNDNFKAFFKDVINSACMKDFYFEYEGYKIDDIITKEAVNQFLASIKFVPMIRKLAAVTFSSLNVYVNSNPLYPGVDYFLDIHETTVRINYNIVQILLAFAYFNSRI
jgi:hypothetical protein